MQKAVSMLVTLWTSRLETGIALGIQINRIQRGHNSQAKWLQVTYPETQQRMAQGDFGWQK